MHPVIQYNEKWLLRIYLGILFSGIVLFVLTEHSEILYAPFVLLYLVTIYINWKAAWWILLFSLPFSVHITLPSDSLAISLPDEPMMWMFLLLLPMLFANKPYIIPQWWLKDPIVIIVILQLLWLAVAVANSQVLFFSIKFFVAKLWYLACFFVFPLWIFTDKKDFKKGFLVMLIPMLATMLYYFFRHATMRFSFPMVNYAIGRFYYNHVEFSTVISIFFPLVCITYPLSKSMKKWIRVSILALIIFFLLVIFFSYARAAILSVFFSFFIALFIRLRLVNIVMPCIYGLITLVMVYLIKDNNYIALRPNYERTYMHSSFGDHMLATFRGQDMSSMERLYRWIAAVRMSTDSPVVGYGPHSFYYFYKPYTLNIFKTYVSKNDEHSTTHNYFLYMLVEQGIPAMALYAILVIAILANAQKTYFRFTDRFYKYCTLGLTMTFAASFVNNFFSELIETHKVGAIFYLSIALLVILSKKSKEMSRAPQPA